ETLTRFRAPEQYAYTVDLSGDDLDRVARAYLQLARNSSWWLNDRPPENIPYALRRPAQMIRGLVAIAGAFPAHRDEATDLAHAAGAYLVKASEDAAFPGAPFPYWRGKSGRLGELSERLAVRLEECGLLDEAVVNGWFVVDAVPQEYFFDTGRVGEALAELHAIDPQPEYATWAEAAIGWHETQPMSVNFNYNAFLVLHLSQMTLSSGDTRHLNGALDRALYGVLPGMIADGDFAGHWVDPHNERFAYRAIMTRALTQLSHALALHPDAASNDDRNRIFSAAQTALTALEAEMIDAEGVASPEEMVEIYLDLEAARDAGAPIDISNPEARAMVRAAAMQSIASGRFNAGAGAGRFLATLRETL
ncbi:MAG: hypothetical protein AAGJ87_12765, partial [Pseudomonadota bacterium]